MVVFGHSFCQAENQETDDIEVSISRDGTATNRVGMAAISGVRFSHSRRGMVARLTSFALSTDASAKSVLTRSRYATNPGGLQAQPAPVTKNPGFAGRHRFLHFVRLRGD